MPRRTIVNLSEPDPTRALVTGFREPAMPPAQNYIRESDMQGFRLFFVEESGDESGETPFKWVDCTTWSVIYGAGTIGLQPTAGTFTLHDPDNIQQTGPIDFDATALEVQAAIQVALVTNWATATVTGSAGAWTITNGANGERTKLTATATLLQPSGSTVIITRTEPGTASSPAQMFVETARALPIGRSSGWTAITKIATAITVHQAGDATHNKIFKLTWDPDAYSGDVQLLFLGDVLTEAVGPIAYNASADDVLAAFEEHTEVGAGGVAVVKEGPGVYYITCVAPLIDLDNTPTLTSPADTIKVPPGIEGSLNVNTAGVTLLLAGATSASVTSEVRVNRGAGWEVVAQIPDCPLFANLIRSDNGVANALDPTPTVSEVILFLPAVTGYITGGATNLDGVATTGLAVNRLFCFVHAVDGLRVYKLTAGTDAEASPGIIRPDDYNGVTNAKVWKSV
jgi:hypothetical protein